MHKLILWPTNSNTLATWCEEPTLWKRLMLGKRKKRVAGDEIVRSHHWFSGHEFEQTLGQCLRGAGQGCLVCRSLWVTKSRTRLRDWTATNELPPIVKKMRDKTISVSTSFLPPPCRLVAKVPEPLSPQDYNRATNPFFVGLLTTWEVLKSCKIHILLWNGQILLFSSKVKSLYRVRLFAIPWTVVYQAFLSMAFSRQEYWNGLPFPSPGDLPDPGIKSRSPALQADALPSEPPGKPLV